MASTNKLGLNFLVNGRPLKSNENGLPIIAISGYLGFPDPREPGQLDNVWLHGILSKTAPPQSIVKYRQISALERRSQP